MDQLEEYHPTHLPNPSTNLFERSSHIAPGTVQQVQQPPAAPAEPPPLVAQEETQTANLTEPSGWEAASDAPLMTTSRPIWPPPKSHRFPVRQRGRRTTVRTTTAPQDLVAAQKGQEPEILDPVPGVLPSPNDPGVTISISDLGASPSWRGKMHREAGGIPSTLSTRLQAPLAQPVQQTAPQAQGSVEGPATGTMIAPILSPMRTTGLRIRPTTATTTTTTARTRRAGTLAQRVQARTAATAAASTTTPTLRFAPPRAVPGPNLSTNTPTTPPPPVSAPVPVPAPAASVQPDPQPTKSQEEPEEEQSIQQDYESASPSPFPSPPRIPSPPIQARCQPPAPAFGHQPNRSDNRIALQPALPHAPDRRNKRARRSDDPLDSFLATGRSSKTNKVPGMTDAGSARHPS